MKCKRRSVKGGLIVEASIGTLILVPAIVISVLVAIETSQAFTIAQAMNEGAYLAAKGLANYYKTNPEVVSSSSEQQAIFSQIRIPNMISSNNQFTIPSGSSGWNTTGTPPTVTVMVSYLSGRGSPPLPSFPNPDPLNLGSLFSISSSSTCALVTN